MLKEMHFFFLNLCNYTFFCFSTNTMGLGLVNHFVCFHQLKERNPSQVSERKLSFVDVSLKIHKTQCWLFTSRKIASVHLILITLFRFILPTFFSLIISDNRGKCNRGKNKDEKIDRGNIITQNNENINFL